MDGDYDYSHEAKNAIFKIKAGAATHQKARGSRHGTFLFYSKLVGTCRVA